MIPPFRKHLHEKTSTGDRLRDAPRLPLPFAQRVASGPCRCPRNHSCVRSRPGMVKTHAMTGDGALGYGICWRYQSYVYLRLSHGQNVSYGLATGSLNQIFEGYNHQKIAIWWGCNGDNIMYCMTQGDMLKVIYLTMGVYFCKYSYFASLAVDIMGKGFNLRKQSCCNSWYLISQ